jgi:hypothetical protein
VWLGKLFVPFIGCIVGALLAAAYSVLVAGVHLVSSGRRNASLDFAAWSVVIGAGLGLALGVLATLFVQRGGSSGPLDTLPLEGHDANGRAQVPAPSEDPLSNGDRPSRRQGVG